MTKDMMAKALSDWFAEEGVESMDLRTYKDYGNDVPVKDYMLRRAFGSWKRVISAMKKRHPVVVAVEAPAPAPASKAPAPKAPKAKKAEKKNVK
tara:strand:- start:535 stop:816 length:282 start_codon:yes stop_codon:yes gene_type:complete